MSIKLVVGIFFLSIFCFGAGYFLHSTITGSFGNYLYPSETKILGVPTTNLTLGVSANLTLCVNITLPDLVANIELITSNTKQVLLNNKLVQVFFHDETTTFWTLYTTTKTSYDSTKKCGVVSIMMPFSHKGTFAVKAIFEGTSLLQPSQSIEYSVVVV